MVPTLNIKRIFRIIEEETRDLRTGVVSEWPRLKDDSGYKESLKEPERYTRVLDQPGEQFFYEFSSKFAGATLLQLDVRYSQVPGEFTPIGAAIGGVIGVPLDDNIACVEIERQAITGPRRDRVFIPMVREKQDDREWENYITWAANQRNWNPQVVALNYSTKILDAVKRLSFTAPLGGASFVLQAHYCAQIIRKSGRTMAVCRFVPVCSEGLMSASWYFGLREAVYFLIVVKETLASVAPAGNTSRLRDIVRWPEPVIDRLAVIT